MSIRQKIEAKRDEIIKDPSKGHTLREKAIAAVYKGIESDEWKAYMGEYGFDATELARMTNRTVESCDPYIDQARAYLLTNAVCTPGTAKNLLFGIGDILDNSLPAQPAGPDHL